MYAFSGLSRRYASGREGSEEGGEREKEEEEEEGEELEKRGR